MKNKVIKELNNFLEGHFMAIHAYEHYIHHMNDKNIKHILQKIQQDHKQHATMIAERIQNIGGVSVDDTSFMGHVAELISDLKGTPDDTVSILKDALVGEQRGIKKSKDILNGDLDSESLTIVEQVLNEDQKHVELLENLVQE